MSSPMGFEIPILLARNKTLIHNSTHSEKKILRISSSFNPKCLDECFKMKGSISFSFLSLHYLATSMWVEYRQTFFTSFLVTSSYLVAWCSMEDRDTTFPGLLIVHDENKG